MSITPDIIPKQIETILDSEIECIGVVMPLNLERNIASFRDILFRYRFPSQIHTVMKVNTSPAILSTGKKLGCRVDISSYGELMKALSHGYTSENITANGPKNKRFLRACIEHSIIIVVDNLSELEELVKNIEKGKKQKLLIRISGFKGAEGTRFGLLREHWESSVKFLDLHKEKFEVLGYSFHIDKRDIELRKSIFWESLTYFKLLRNAGFKPNIINVGGGYGVRYQDDTNIKNTACNRFHLGSRLYPQDDGPVGVDFLERFLSDRDIFGTSIGSFLEENALELWIEPGRSLMQNVGYGATRIIALRHDTGDTSLVLDANSFSLGMREEELPTDPFLLGENDGKHHEYSLLGNLCLESDIFFCRHVNLSREARVGDIIIFPDIGAYHTDFYETESISHPKKSRYFQIDNTLYPDNF
ncbi:hypothetical protein KBD33_01025 [Candidatus Gracilibacteria bacterium]|nr:hypothetical protein [Candidatus Gracilibacteria bacterium]